MRKWVLLILGVMSLLGCTSGHDPVGPTCRSVVFHGVDSTAVRARACVIVGEKPAMPLPAYGLRARTTTPARIANDSVICCAKDVVSLASQIMAPLLDNSALGHRMVIS